MGLCIPQLWIRSSFTGVRSRHFRLKACLRSRKNPSRVAVAVAVAGPEVLGDGTAVLGLLLQVVDPWAPTVGSGININSQSLASQLFAASLFPYLGFLYHITRSNSSPKLTLFGFYFLLAFVAATIPAGIYAKLKYGTSLANVDWLHGGAESLLTLTNLFIVLGLRKALRKNEEESSGSRNEENTS